jgi:hypothetical protein
MLLAEPSNQKALLYIFMRFQTRPNSQKILLGRITRAVALLTYQVVVNAEIM